MVPVGTARPVISSKRAIPKDEMYDRTNRSVYTLSQYSSVNTLHPQLVLYTLSQYSTPSVSTLHPQSVLCTLI